MIPLGTLTIPAASSVNNQTTAVPFAIPIGCPALEFATAGTDVTVVVALDAGTPATLAATAGSFALIAGVALPIDCPPYNPNAPAVCACFSTAGATVTVNGLWGA